ncbi:hypothetical protein BT69DRAFT_347291 [Atractiella rhizophila]|nr:hypothetical protein BT69DRAFT_347291 [Atractiella rhizophila]
MKGAEYRGAGGMKGKGRRKEEILEHVQCSEMELEELFRVIRVLKSGEEYFILEDGYIAELLLHLLKLMDGISMSIEELNIQEIREAIDEELVDPDDLPSICSLLPNCSPTSLDRTTVIRLIGQPVLSSIPSSTPTSNITLLSSLYSSLPSFLHAELSLPLFRPHLSLLPDGETFIRLPLDDLPSEPKELIRALFGIRDVWDVEEMMGILTEVGWTGAKEAESWVLRWGRKSTDKGKTWVSRKGI